MEQDFVAKTSVPMPETVHDSPADFDQEGPGSSALKSVTEHLHASRWML